MSQDPKPSTYISIDDVTYFDLSREALSINRYAHAHVYTYIYIYTHSYTQVSVHGHIYVYT